MIQFKTGQRVIAIKALQGLVTGQTYRVNSVHMQHTSLGEFVIYMLDGGQRVSSRNAHLVMRSLDSHNATEEASQ